MSSRCVANGVEFVGLGCKPGAQIRDAVALDAGRQPLDVVAAQRLPQLLEQCCVSHHHAGV